MISAILEHN